MKKKHVLKNYIIGLIIGTIMVCSLILINILSGGTKIEGINERFNTSSILFIFIYFFGFVLQGASEEIVFRGFLMTEIGAKNKISTAIIISSLIFTLAHILNPDITISDLIGVFLLGVFFALYVICFDNIWGACAIHSIWNFTLVNIFGIESIFNITDIIFKSTVIKATTFNEQLIEMVETSVFFSIPIILLILYMKKTGKITKTIKEKECEN